MRQQLLEHDIDRDGGDPNQIHDAADEE